MAAKPSGAESAAQGDVWEVDLNPTVGHEQAGRRPVLIVSANALNHSQRGLVIVAPVTSTIRGFPTHILVNPPEGGLTRPSALMTEQVRSISKARLIRRLGSVSAGTMNQVKHNLEIVFDL